MLVQSPWKHCRASNTCAGVLYVLHLPLGGDDAKGDRPAVWALAHHQLEGLLLLLVLFQFFAALP